MDKARPKVLCVDDDEVVRLYTEAALSAHYDVVSAKDGCEALEALRLHRFDLILVDYRLPDMSGTQFIRAARWVAGEVRFALVSGQQADRIDWEGLAPFNLAACIQKPLEPEQVVRLIG